jgi:hypothetical protein
VEDVRIAGKDLLHEPGIPGENRRRSVAEPNRERIAELASARLQELER